MADAFQEVLAGLDALRARGRLLTNYFFSGPMPVGGRVAVDGALGWWHDEHGFSRLHFAAVGADALAALLARLPALDFVCDALARDGSSERASLQQAFAGAGYAVRATFARHTAAAVQGPAGSAAARLGTPQDARAIYDGIFSDFDRTIDHIPSLEAFVKSAEERRLIVFGPVGAVAAYAGFSVEGRRFHFDRLCNRRGDPLALLGVLRGLYREIAQRGLASGFLWCNRANAALRALHERCGFRADGMLDDIHTRLQR